MANDREQQQAKDKHYRSMGRLQDLRRDIDAELNRIINHYYDQVPSDLAYETEERGYLREDLRKIQNWIDDTLSNL